jgi:hypothetical protein
MRHHLLRFLLLLAAGGLTLSLLRGQDRTGTPAGPPAAGPSAGTPPSGSRPPAGRPGGEGTAGAPARVNREPAAPPPAPDGDRFARLGPLQKQLLLSAQRGADWLYRMNGLKGRFLYGYLPALKAEMEGDDFLRQIGAAGTLARAARFTGEERYAARATQAILALLEETATDPQDAKVRFTALPSIVVNRLGAAGLLVLAVNELPAPQADLLDRSEELCNYLRRQARPDGSLRCQEEDAAEAADAPDACYPALALAGLARSQEHRPAAWKLDLLRKAVAHYHPWWQAHKNLAAVAPFTAACADAHRLTREAIFAQFTGDMNDWLCTLQYDQIDPRHLLWFGGFTGWADGRKVETDPDAGSAACAEALADARRVARATGDAVRHQRYTEALERALQFLVTVQYTDANTQHFADWYRPRLVGAFHASPRDGNLRLDYTEHAVSALVRYLEQVAPPPAAGREALGARR